jgi:hypothetical protein
MLLEPVRSPSSLLHSREHVELRYGWNNELFGSLRLGSLKLVIDKAWIIKLVKDNEPKSLFGSARYMLASAHELLVKIIKKILLKPHRYFNTSVGNTYTS